MPLSGLVGAWLRLRRSSVEVSRQRVRRHLRAVIAEVRVVNPRASEAAELLAKLLERMLFASEREIEVLIRLIGPGEG
ncbi:MAG TPA: hypothetical protein ENG69_02745 [Candidatus Korarchaeota archaeon]|nr:hypothetical protein [Candidatus Korarchaeota archaeon]